LEAAVKVSRAALLLATCLLVVFDGSVTAAQPVTDTPETATCDVDPTLADAWPDGVGQCDDEVTADPDWPDASIAEDASPVDEASAPDEGSAPDEASGTDANSVAASATVAAAAPTTVQPAAPTQTLEVRVTVSGTRQALTVTVAAGNGTLDQIEFGNPAANPPTPVNASIDIGAFNGREDAFVFTPSSPTDQLTLQVRAVHASSAVTVPLVVTDDCGAWPTLVGVG
jgi:hypothetical protein